jgi:Kef-type K+ transport system membrane component KefB
MEPHFPPVLFLLIGAAAAPAIAGLTRRIGLSVVVIELLLGIAVGPQGLGLVSPTAGALPAFSTMGMAFLFFIAGLEIDLTAIRGRPLRLALVGWFCGLALAVAIALGMAAAGLTSAWRVVAVALMTTALGVLVPILRDSGAIATPLGRHVLASGVMGELGPILAISLMISRRFSAGVQAGLTTAFVLVVILLAWLMARGAKVPALLEPIRRGLDNSGQTPIRIALVLIVALAVLAETFGMDLALGALAAGMMVGFATRGGERVHELHAKIDAVGFGFLIPLFFLSSGMKLDVRSIFAGSEGLALLVVFFVALVVVRLPLLLLLRSELGSQGAPGRDTLLGHHALAHRRDHGCGGGGGSARTRTRGANGRRRRNHRDAVPRSRREAGRHVGRRRVGERRPRHPLTNLKLSVTTFVPAQIAIP